MCGHKPREAGGFQKLEKSKETDCPLESSEGTQPCQSILDFRPPEP